ncbi:DUF2497 domain-containing protein [Rhodomicrobium sp.]|uniref:DUF2497 domain-containing protein n=1 Tax=Rhodomicrobium sp. TaxID=2720632 RepID=UPI0039E4B772
MNRADQAPEPSMEEILASIRSIISEDGKPSATESGRPTSAGSPVRPVEEDVLDLTEELVFPVERAASSVSAGTEPNHRPAQKAEPVAQAPATAREERRAVHPVSAQAMSPMERVAAHLETPRAETTGAEPYRRETPGSGGDSHDVQPRPVQAPPRTIWSRRELPGAPAATPIPAAPVTPRVASDATAPRPQKRWAEDIHMPIPAAGPVPLIPQDIQPRAEETPKTQAAAAPEPEANAATGPEDSAMAVLAERLARDAVEAMDAEELAQAGEVDFETLADDRKAEVTESFASAIERQSAGKTVQPLPSLLDEVLRHDFRHDVNDEEDQEAEGREAAAFEPVTAQEAPLKTDDAALDAPAEAADPVQSEAAETEIAQAVSPGTEPFREIEEARSEDLPSEEAQADEAGAPDGRSVEQEHFHQAHFEQEPERHFDAPVQRGPRPDFAPWLLASTSFDSEPASEAAASEPEPEPVVEEAEPPLAQARFIGAEQPSPSYPSQALPAQQAHVQAPAPSQAAAVPPTATGPLEAAVREMLRPMLVQWLNENMPRILESAIRDEIAARGVFPKSDDQV